MAIVAEETLVAELRVTDELSPALESATSEIKKFGSAFDSAGNRVSTSFAKLSDATRGFDRLLTKVTKGSFVLFGADIAARTLGFSGLLDLVGKSMDVVAQSIAEAARHLLGALVPSLEKASKETEAFRKAFQAALDTMEGRNLVPLSDALAIDLGPLEGQLGVMRQIQASVEGANVAYDQQRSLLQKLAPIISAIDLTGKVGLGGTKEIIAEDATRRALAIQRELSKALVGTTHVLEDQAVKVKGVFVEYDKLGKLQVRFQTVRVGLGTKELDEIRDKTAKLRAEFEKLGGAKLIDLAPLKQAVPLIEALTGEGVGFKFSTAFGPAKAVVDEYVKGLVDARAKLQALVAEGGVLTDAEMRFMLESQARIAEALRVPTAEDFAKTNERLFQQLAGGMELAAAKAELARDPYDQLQESVAQIGQNFDVLKVQAAQAVAGGLLDPRVARELIILYDQLAEKQKALAGDSFTFAGGIKQALAGFQTIRNQLGGQLVTGTFDALRTGFRDLITGAEDFGDAIGNMARSFVNNLADMAAQFAAFKLTTQLFKGTQFGGFVAGLFGQSAAKGGIFSGGLQANLQSYGGGGIAVGPQVARIGDNPAKVEAVVPLEGRNRGIPVEFRGGRGASAGGGGTVNLNVSMGVVSLDSRNATEVVRGALPGLARELGELTASMIQSGRVRNLNVALRGV